MSTRYDDTYRDREYDRRGRHERPANERGAAADERDTGRGLRRDVRETGQDIRSAGSDIITSWCGLWGNLLISLGEVISPQSGRSSGRSSDPDEGGEGRSGISCGGGEFSVRCDTSEGRAEGRGGRGGEGRREGGGRRGAARDDRDDRDDRTTAHFSGGDTEIDVAT